MLREDPGTGVQRRSGVPLDVLAGSLWRNVFPASITIRLLDLY